jgi:hypothetical protein
MMYKLTTTYKYNPVAFTTAYPTAIDAREAAKRYEQLHRPARLWSLTITRNGRTITDLDLAFDAVAERKQAH